MPDMWVDVDTAVTVPVNILPLIDDTDFKSREVAIVYNQAGMDLVWNFQTSAGVTSQTAVTPTTAGDYDWTHMGDGMYKIEIPASGGVSINNDTEGYGWFTGICTGVLAWRGPVIGFRAAALNDALCDGGDNLDVNVTQFGGSAGTFASGRPEVNTTHAAGTAWGSGAITAASIASSALTAAKFDTACLTSAKFATGAFTTSVFAAGAIDAAAIATDAIGSAELAAGAVDKIVDQVWDELIAGHAGVGSTGESLNAKSTHAAADVWTSGTRTLTAATNITSTGGTTVPQTGDSFARLGAPAGASVSADIAAMKVDTAAILVDTAEIGAAGAGLTGVASIVLTTQMTESYAADGVAPTLAQAVFLVQQSLHEFAISGTTRTVKQLDGTTTAATFTLDDATSPTSTTRAT